MLETMEGTTRPSQRFHAAAHLYRLRGGRAQFTREGVTGHLYFLATHKSWILDGNTDVTDGIWRQFPPKHRK